MAIKKQTFMKGVLVIMLAQIIIKLFGFVYRIILTNFKEFADVGNSYYGSGYAVYTFILAIATMGIPNTLSKLISEKMAVGDKRGAHRIFRTALYLFTTIGIVFALGLFFGAEAISNNLLNNPGVKYSLMALAPAIIFVAMSAVLRGYFVGMQNMMEYSKAQVLEQFVNSILSVVFVVMLLGRTPEIMAAGSTLGTTVATAAAFAYMYLFYNKNKKDIWSDIKNSPMFEIDRRKKIVKKLISYVIPISFANTVVAISGIIDVVTVMEGLKKYGYSLTVANEKFGIILGKVDILIAVPLSLNVAFAVALVPFISAAMARGERDEAVKKINFSIKVSSLIALPCAAGLSILAEPIILMLFPNASQGAYLLQIQAWMVVFAVLAQTVYGSLQGLGKLYIPGICLLIGVFVKYTLNYTFIPIYGETIASYSSVIYQFVAFSISFIFLFRYLKQKPKFNELFIKPIIATAVMIIFMFGSKMAVDNLAIINTLPSYISTLTTIFLAIVVYMYTVLRIGILSDMEMKSLPFGSKILQISHKMRKK